MICKKCGAEIPDNVAFCTNCGVRTDASAAAPQQDAVSSNVNQSNNMAGGMPPQGIGYYQPQHMGIGGWIGRMLIPFIPIVGGLVYLIMLFVWMGDNTKDETFRNWAKAKLILTAISIILTILVFTVFGAAIASIITNYDSMW